MTAAVPPTAGWAHGGPDGDDALRPVRADFSTSVNAYGPAEVVAAAVREAVAPARLAAYPDPTCGPARRALAELAGVGAECVVLGAGAAELILAAALALVRAGDRVLVPRHAFGGYARAARACGAAVVVPDEGEPFADAVRRRRPRLAFFCTPESPAGRVWARAEALRAADACAEAGAALVLDQSFDAFAGRPLGTPALPGHPAVLHLRSLTKDHALAGVRVGYLVAAPALARRVEAVRVPWAVSTPAQAAAVAACTPEARAHVRRTVALLREGAAAMRAGLGAAADVPTGVHYFLVRAGDAARAAGLLRARHALRVRDCASFGLPAYVRVAARTPAENRLLLGALRDVLADVSLPTPHV